MMVVLRIVCALIAAVLWGSGILQAAPTVTYDQRQHGDFNLQVDLDDVAILLLPGSEMFAQRSAFSDRVHKIFGRRNGGGGHSKKKQKYCSTTTSTTTTTTTERPTEVPYSETTPSLTASSTSQEYEEVPHGPEEVPLLSPQESTGSEKTDYYAVDTNDRPGESAAADRNTAVSSIGDPLLSDTPAATNVLAADHHHSATEAGNVVVVADPAAVKTEEKSAVVETVTGLTEMVVVKTVEKSTTPVNLDGVMADVKPIETASTDVAEKQPTVVSSDVKTAGDETAKIEETVTVAVKVENTVTPSGEKSNIVVENPEKAAEISKTAEDKAAEANVDAKPVLKPTDAESAGKSVVAAADEKNGEVMRVGNTNVKPVEMVAMKTMEKPTFAEALKVVQKPAAAATTANDGAAGVTDKPGVPSLDGVVVGKEPTEMIAMKIMEKPSSTETTVDRSGITTSTNPSAEVQGDKKTAVSEFPETIVSRSAPKLTEMVAVKTMENPATMSTVKSVISVKTVIRPGTPKTTILSNGSSIMRKVGDRKPLPSITLDVAPPRVV